MGTSQLRSQPVMTFAVATGARAMVTGGRISNPGVLVAGQDPTLLRSGSSYHRPHGALRAFSDAAESGESRVIKRVQKYALDRKSELEKSTEVSGDKEKTLVRLVLDVTASTRGDDLGFDDLDKVEVLLEVEEEFNHTMPDEDADAINSVEET